MKDYVREVNIIVTQPQGRGDTRRGEIRQITRRSLLEAQRDKLQQSHGDYLSDCIQEEAEIRECEN